MTPLCEISRSGQPTHPAGHTPSPRIPLAAFLLPFASGLPPRPAAPAIPTGQEKPRAKCNTLQSCSGAPGRREAVGYKQCLTSIDYLDRAWRGVVWRHGEAERKVRRVVSGTPPKSPFAAPRIRAACTKARRHDPALLEPPATPSYPRPHPATPGYPRPAN